MNTHTTALTTSFRRTETSTAIYFGTNHLGSTTLLTDASGDILFDMETTPFGDQENREEMFYTGKQWDAELYYFNARWYDADVGRFITEDPIKDGLNWYVYTGNNPINFVDYSGYWKDNVHYDLTIEWAIEAGFSEREAIKIAEANVNVDNIFYGNSFLPGELGDQRYHFNLNGDENYDTIKDSRQELALEHFLIAENFKKLKVDAEKRLEKAIKNGDTYNSFIEMNNISNYENEMLNNLGYGLHALQDIYAHTIEFQRELLPGIYCHDSPELTLGTKENLADDIEVQPERIAKTELSTKKYFEIFLGKY